MKPTFCVHLCWIILDVYRFIGLIRKSQHILTFHFPHNFQEFHGIALFPVWCGPAVQRREKLTFLQAPRAKAYDSRFSQLLDHDDVRFPSVGIPRLRQLREVDLLFARLIHKFVCWYCWDLCYCYTGLSCSFFCSCVFVLHECSSWISNYFCVFSSMVLFILSFSITFNSPWCSVDTTFNHARFFAAVILLVAVGVFGFKVLRSSGGAVRVFFAGKKKVPSAKTNIAMENSPLYPGKFHQNREIPIIP